MPYRVENLLLSTEYILYKVLVYFDPEFTNVLEALYQQLLDECDSRYDIPAVESEYWRVSRKWKILLRIIKFLKFSIEV